MSKYDKYVKENKLNNPSTSKVSTSKTTTVSKYSKYKDSSVTQKTEDNPITQKPVVRQDTTLTDAYAKKASTNQFANDILSQSPTIQKINSLPSKELTNKEMFKDNPSRKIPYIGKVLQALDSISSNKAVKTVGEVGRAFYTPGGTVANIAGFTGAVGRKSAELLPKVAKSLAGNAAGRVAQTALKESTVGFPLGVGQYQSTGGDNTKEALKAGAIGAAFGGGLGAVGKTAGELVSAVKRTRAEMAFDKMFPVYDKAAKSRNVLNAGEIDKGEQAIMDRLNFIQRQTNKEMPLQLNEPKSVTKARELQQRSVLPANTDVIRGKGNIHTFELPEGNYTAPTRLKINNANESLDYVMRKIKPEVESKLSVIHENTAEARAQLDDVTSQIDNMKAAYQAEVNSQIKWLKEQRGLKGVHEKGGLVRDEVGNVTGRQGTISGKSNDYQMLSGGKYVNNKSIEEEAIRRVNDGYDTGYGGNAPAWAKDNNYHESLASLEQVKAQLGDSLDEVSQRGIYDLAKQVAASQGHDLDALFEKQGGTFADIAKKAKSNAAYGKPVEKVNVAKPNFNVTHENPVAMPETKTKSVVSPAEVPKVSKYAAEREKIVSTVKPMNEPVVNGSVSEPIPFNSKPVQINDAAPVSKYAKYRATIAENKPASEKERGFIKTLKESDKTPEEVKTTIKGRYTPLSNKTSVNLANKRVNKDLEVSASYVMGKSQFNAEKVATAHRVIDEFNRSGNFQRSVDIAESIAKEGTAAGQGSQAFAIYNRLTSEGILVHAQRIVAKTNEKLNVIQKDVVLTAEMAENLVDLTNTNRAMMGVKDLSNNVMDILERAKSGKKLNAEDSEALLKFVNESKQFIKEVEKKPTIKPPTVVKDKRIKDNVIKFLDKQEEAAKERLRARGHRISSMPLDIYADYAIIGAAKMARGAIKFPEWSASMIKDLGEEIRPMLESIYNRSSEAMNQSAKKVTKTSVSNAEKIVNKLIKDKKITGEEADYIKTLAEKVSDLSGYAKNIASQDLQFILRKLEKPTLLQKVSSTQTIGMLLNPKTQVRNALGNELFYRLERINKLATTPLDWLRVELFGGKRSVTFRTNNQGEYWKSWLMGLKAGWRGVNVEGLQTQFDLGPAAFSAKWNPLTYMEKALGASLKSFDTAAYKRAANNTIGELATLRAINEGLTGEAKKIAIQKYIRNVDDHVLQVADDYGKYMTFQDNNLISTGLVKLKRGMNLGKDFGMGDLILKFPKTPGALLMRALEYSPAGFLRSASIAAKPFFKKDPNTAEAMQALTRAIVGTGGLSGLGWYLMDAGILTGAASKDKDVRDLQRTAGQGQYQVNLSALTRWARSGFDHKEAQLKEGDTLSTYDWMQPVAIAVSLGAEAGKSIEQNKSKGQAAVGLLGSAYSSIEGGVNSLVETSVLSGLKRATTSYPGQSISDKIVDILGSAPASFIPTSVNQYKQLTDNAQRETYDPSKLEQIFNQLKVKIPGVASQLPQRYDTLGSKKTTYQNNSIFNVLFNPSFVSKYKLTPEAKMVVKLIADTGDLSAAPRVPSKNITVYGDDGKSNIQKLTTEQFVELQRRTGEETVRLLKLIPNDFTNEQKLRAIADMLTDAGKKARYDLKQGMGVR